MHFSVFLVLFMCFCVINCSGGVPTCRQKVEGYVYTTLRCFNNTQSFPVADKPVISLECFDCNIPVLNQETILKRFVGEAFNLSNSHIHVISENVFSEFTKKTQRFIFENNEIDDVSPKVFSKFSKLEEINFRNSKISQLTAGIFDGTYVTELTLSENLFSGIDRIFEGLKVTRLNLSSNNIREIRKDSFARTIFIEGNVFPRDQRLDLSNNLIEKIYSGGFKCSDVNNCVKILELAKNSITRIESYTFLENSYLSELSLSENSITQLESNSFRGLINLKSLNLRHNLIQNIPVSMFADLQQLKTLDLSQNLISLLQLNTFSGLTSLEILNISHNSLETFNHLHILPLGRLTDLDISDIKLHHLNLTLILHTNFKLRNLILNDNFWICSDLIDLYKEMNKFGGFKSPTRHFEISNLHGIACSRQKLDSYEDLTFNKFLKIVSEDKQTTDWFDLKLHTNENIYTNDYAGNYLKKIYGMFVFIVIIVVLIIAYCIIKLIMQCLYDHNILKFHRLSFLYVQDQRNVQVCS
ncbi:hypothetical protein RI129_003296 [Pyrocoelia pectoralis]|uniref:Uncharacterized protein n=1 Tax=Pyrocoelia pectoralis TaxID=417401 RepID=A0AAN7VQW0_9COLE